MKLDRNLLRKLAGAALFLGLGVWTLKRSDEWTFEAFYWLVVIRLFVVAVLFLYRAPAKRSSGVWMQVGAIISTFIPLAFTGEGSEPAIPYEMFNYAWAVCIGGTLLGIWGFISLGKSFGISPALRERVVRGPYRFVDHPIYIGHVSSDFGFLLMAMSTRNAIIVTLNTVFLIIRAREENRLLREPAPTPVDSH